MRTWGYQYIRSIPCIHVRDTITTLEEIMIHTGDIMSSLGVVQLTGGAH